MVLYLHDIPLEKAQSAFYSELENHHLAARLGVEEVPLDEHALGRVLAEPIWAKISSPHYHASAMDGFAVRSGETIGALPGKPITLTLTDQAVYVDTGDPLPDWADAVVPIELVEPVGGNDPRHPDAIRLRASLTPWSHVRPLGEDIVATQLVLAAGHVLRPVDLGALASSGSQTLLVARKPRVAILPTGTELVPMGTVLRKGDIVESNSIVLAGQILDWGAEPHRLEITPDDFNLLCNRIQQAADTHDLVLVNAGSSAGSEDFTARIVEKTGKLLVHGVAVRPGHPVILGMIRRSDQNSWVPVVGVPGYPVSAALTGEIFVKPLIAIWLGKTPDQPEEITAHLTRKITSPPGDDDFVRVVVGRVGERMLAAPLNRGAGTITSLVRADGITMIPRGVQGYDAGQPVQVRLYRSQDQIRRTIFAIGSHDMTLDLLASALESRGRRLVSANVGSQGGLVAIRRGETHMAGCHLLDPDSGVYNLAAVKEYLPEMDVKIVRWVQRQQGLIVARGNPKEIHGLEDLAKPGVSFVNRQRGAGTRVLLDFQLKQLGIDAASILGYEREEFTHLAVAAAIASGRADCGMGIAAAAEALDLDFIRLYHEDYDLVIPRKFMDSGFLDPIFDLMADVNFRQSIAAMAGYDVSLMGKVIL